VQTGDPPYRQLRIVGDCRADANNDSIDQRAQPMQMVETGRSIDVFRMPGRSRDTTVERLPNLADDDHFVDRSGLKWLEKFAPWCRQRLAQSAKRLREFGPGIDHAAFVRRMNSGLGRRFLRAVQSHTIPSLEQYLRQKVDTKQMTLRTEWA